MSELESMQQDEKVDMQKLGEDIAYLAKNGKFAEIKILSKQVGIPMRRFADAIDVAVNQIESEGNPDSTGRGTRDRISHNALALGGVGALGGWATGIGALPAGLAGVAAGIVIGFREGKFLENAKKLKEAKEWIESN